MTDELSKAQLLWQPGKKKKQRIRVGSSQSCCARKPLLERPSPRLIIPRFPVLRLLCITVKKDCLSANLYREKA